MSKKNQEKIADDNRQNEPVIIRTLLNPVDRISEILFGLIMALTFTCTISVIESDRTVVKDMLIGAIGCNIAWGLVDAVMYMIITLTEKGRAKTIYNFVRRTNDRVKANNHIADVLPPIIASLMEPGDFDKIREKVMKLPESPVAGKFGWTEIKIAAGIFLLVFLSTFPVALPFVFISDLQTALRTSNLIAIIMMFICGWNLGKYASRKRLLMGSLMSLIGVALVLITIALGG